MNNIFHPFSWALVILTVFSGSAIGQQTVVSPGKNATVEGTLQANTPTGPFRIQWLQSASDFTDSIPEGGAFISGHSYRADESESALGANSFGDTTFILSTTNETALSTTFDDNTGDDAVVVFEGMTPNISYPVDGPAGGPNPFAANVVEYDNLFFYDPHTMGNLVIEQVVRVGNETPDLAKDWEATDSTTVVATLGEITDVAAISDNSVIVMQFTIVPEPSSSALFVLGVSSVYLRMRRRSQLEDSLRFSRFPESLSR